MEPGTTPQTPGIRFGLGDVVNVIGLDLHLAISEKPNLIPGVCGVVPGSIHPRYTGIEAGLSATGDIFDAIGPAREFEHYRSIARPGTLSCRRDGLAAAHVGQWRPHRAGQSRVDRRDVGMAAHQHAAG